jgi:tRNA(fMet)-specific endonuclease VapC
MAGSLLLDTSFIIELFFRNADAERVVAAASELYIPSIALGELLYGAERSSRRADNIAQIEDFAASVAVLSCDAETAWRYGEIKSSLRAKGRPLPDNDIWIASVARQHQLTVATRDAHFNEIPGLALLSWK